MKKKFLPLFLIFMCIALLCGCSGEPSEENSALLESSSSSSSSSSKIKDFPALPSESSESEIESYGGSAFKDDPTVTYLGMAGDTEVYKKAVETGEMRLDIVYGKDGVFNTTTEVPATEYWIIDSEGNLLIEQPFYDCMIMDAESWGSLDYRYPTLYGNYKGTFFWYIWDNGKYEIAEIKEAGEIDSDENLFGYKKTRYSYNCKYEHILQGLNDKNGNVIFEPVFSYILIPFEDRFVVNTNNVDRSDRWEGFSVMMDADKNILCIYTHIDFYFFDDGSYIGIARYVGGNEKSGHLLYDENGELLELGFRFIDKNGDELSPCLGTEYLAYSIDEYAENYLDEFLTDFNGNTLEFTGRDFICEP